MAIYLCDNNIFNINNTLYISDTINDINTISFQKACKLFKKDIMIFIKETKEFYKCIISPNKIDISTYGNITNQVEISIIKQQIYENNPFQIWEKYDLIQNDKENNSSNIDDINKDDKNQDNDENIEDKNIDLSDYITIADYKQSDNEINSKIDILENIIKNIQQKCNDLEEKNNNILVIPGNKLYTAGLISDIHHDDICAEEGKQHISDDTGNTYNPYEDLDNALKYYKKSEVDFILSAGDLSTNYIEHVNAFYNRVKELIPNIPVYSCKGNHDNAACYNNNDKWLKYTIPSNTKYEINYFNTGDKTSYYFISENNDVFIIFNLDYNNKNSWATELLDDKVSYQFYNEDNIKELQSILDLYRNNRVFIFTHLPFSQKAGNVYYDYTVNRTHTYWLSGKQFYILNKLNNYYKNTIWFTGHTHYQWQWQSLSDRANICNWDVLNDNYDITNYKDWARNFNNLYTEKYSSNYIKSGWNIHIPSLSRPLVPQNYAGIENYEEAIVDPGSEGGIMDIYENCVNIKGIIFANKETPIIETKDSNDNTIYNIEYENKLSDIANYWIPIGGKNIENIESKEFEYFEAENSI